jgi:hypothetical protein
MLKIKPGLNRNLYLHGGKNEDNDDYALVDFGAVYTGR